MAKERDYFGTEIPSSDDGFSREFDTGRRRRFVRTEDPSETESEPDLTPLPPAYASTPINAVDQHWLYLAIILNSALYLAAVFVAGLVTDHPTAWKMAAGDFGLCYLGPMVQMVDPKAKFTAGFVVVVSIIIGFAAGISLLV